MQPSTRNRPTLLRAGLELLGPAILGAWGAAPRPVWLLPENASGVLWTHGHLSVFAKTAGRVWVRGFRAHLAYHLLVALPGLRAPISARLLRGVRGAFYDDSFFLQRVGSRRDPQTVVFRERDPGAAAEFADRLRQTMIVGTYRYPPPRPPGTGDWGATEARMYRALLRAEQSARPWPATNCITVPVQEIELALGALPQVYVDDDLLAVVDGTFASGAISVHEAGRATRMRAYLANPGLTNPLVQVASYSKRAIALLEVLRLIGILALFAAAIASSLRLGAVFRQGQLSEALRVEAALWAGGAAALALSARIGPAVLHSRNGIIGSCSVVINCMLGLLIGALSGLLALGALRCALDSQIRRTGGATLAASRSRFAILEMSSKDVIPVARQQHSRSR